MTAQWTDAVHDAFKQDSLFPPGAAIDGMPDGVVYARDTISTNGRWFAEAVFARGPFSVRLFVTGPVRHGPARAAGLAVDQYARLA